jgi:hypothetical protein
MSNSVSDVFGMVLIGAAAILGVWEQVVYSHRQDSPWLVTRRRYRRRMLVSSVLAAVGSMIVMESRQLLNIQRPSILAVYVFSLGCLCILLVILAAIDVADTARNAVKHSLWELEKALDEQRKEQAGNGEGDLRD